MTPRRHKTEFARLAAAVFVLLFAAVSLHAQEEKEKKREREPSRPAGEQRNSRPANSAPERRSEQPAGQEVHRQSRPAESQPAQRAPRQATPEAPANTRPATAAPPAGRPASQQAPSPAVGQRPERQRPVQNDRPGGVPNNSPRQNDRPAGVQGNRPGNQPGEPGRQFGGNNRPGDRPVDRTVGNRPAPRVVTTSRGDTIRRDPAGRVSEVHMKSGAVVYHSPSGVRRVEVVRPGGRVVVASAPGHGYVQRQVIFNNRPIVKRTYIVNGVPYARIYRPVTYRGVVLNVYTPVRYYRPAFYVYAYNPWARPVIYNWGWAGNPWYGYYGGYFAPYPAYASPTLWLTDYMLAATLQAAYQDRMASSAPPPPDNSYAPGGAVGLTPEVKQSIADEVRRQIDQERAQGQSMNGNSGASDVPVFADNGPHVFVASASLLVNSSAGECTIGEGDVLQMTGPPPQNSSAGDVVVLASRGQDCRKGNVVSVQLQDLQEMQNHMRETIDRGLGDLQAHQGQNGIPALPAGAAGTIDTPLAAEAQPDSNAGAELTQVVQETNQAEQSALSQGGDAGAAPPTLTLGLTIDEVKATQGPPQKIVDLGSKKIYVYPDLKITFTDGKVTDIQ